MAKKNWDQIRNQKALDTAKYRDVYEDQQLERGSLAEKQSMFSRNILNGIVCALIFAAIWVGFSFYDMYFGPKTHEMNANPEYLWVHFDEHYVNVNDANDKITVAEYNHLLKDVYDPTLEDIEKPEKPDVSYDRVTSGGKPVFKVHALDGKKMNEAEYNEWSSALLDEYDAKMEQYNEYMRHKENPEEKYKYQKEHYRSVSNLGNVILPATYENLVAEYKNKMSAGKYSEDQMDIPIQPINPSALYFVSEYLLDGNGKKVKDEDGNTIPVSYKSKFDATVLSANDYQTLKMDYDTEKAAYDEAFLAHRKQFHPDRVDEKANYLDMRPTPIKFFVGLLAAGVTFAILYSVFKKNLKRKICFQIHLISTSTRMTST